MKKSELIDVMKKENPNFTEDQITKAIDAIFAKISDALTEGGRVEIRGFGAFSVRAKPARTGRNPRTGEPVDIAAKNVIHFKAGKDLKQAVNEAA